MSIFRRRERSEQAAGSAAPAGPAPRATSTAARSRDDRDWRSYDDVADTYVRIHEPRMALAAADLVELLEPAAGSRLLDVGTGTGVVARAALPALGERGVAVGIDPSLPMLGRAARRDGARYAAAEAIDLPFRDATFDTVTMAFVLPHFRRYETALFDVMRVLRPGGKLGVATWGGREDDFQRAWREVCWEFAEPEVLRDALAQAMPWEERFRNPEALKAALHDAGLRDILVSRREYRFQITAEDYLVGRETAASGRFLRQMLGEGLWERARARARAVFAERFPERFNDFRDVNMAVGFKP